MFRPVLKDEVRDTSLNDYLIKVTDNILLVADVDIARLPTGKVAQGIELGMLKALLMEVRNQQLIVIDDAAIYHGMPRDGAIFAIGDGSTNKLSAELAGDKWSQFAGGVMDEALTVHLDEKYGPNGIGLYTFPLQIDYSSLTSKATNSIRTLTPQGCLIAELERAACGFHAGRKTRLSSARELIHFSQEHRLMTRELILNTLDVLYQQVEKQHISTELGETLAESATLLYEAIVNEEAKHQSVADIYWQKKSVGYVGIESENRDMAVYFHDPKLHQLFGANSMEKKERTPSFIAQMLPGFMGDDQHTVLQTMRHGLHGLGNISIVTESLPLRHTDVRDISIKDAVDSDNVFRQTIYGVIRPSMVESNESLHLEPFQHQQYKNDRDEVAVSGNQPKTIVHLQKHGNSYSIHHSGRNDNATHLLKIPKNAIDKNSTLGGREWLSMSVAAEMGLDIPSFAMVDLNQTTKQYVAAAHLDDDEVSVNVATVDVKKQLFSGGLNIGDDIKSDEIISDFESRAGNVVEPPGYIIELFCLPDKDHADTTRLYGMDFCGLMGLDTKQRFKGSMEDVCLALRRHSTDFESDRKELMKRFLCSWMLGDGDLHLKNISLLITNTENETTCRLSPAYDILSMAGLSGYSVNSALRVNGTHQPQLTDFIQVGMHHLDMSAKEVANMAQSMAEKALAFTTRFRGAESVEQNSTFPNIPDIAKAHKATNRALTDMTHGIEVSLATKGLLSKSTVESIMTRTQRENESVYKESLSLFGDVEPHVTPGHVISR